MSSLQDVIRPETSIIAWCFQPYSHFGRILVLEVATERNKVCRATFSDQNKEQFNTKSYKSVGSKMLQSPDAHLFKLGIR